MAHNKPCCEPNNCVEIIPSKCVKYTGTPTTNGPIDTEFTCTPYLNDVINLFDDDLKEIIEKIGINKTALDNANTSCGLGLVITDLNFKTWLSVNGQCILDEPCVPAGGIIDLRGLLQALITKLCSCCPNP